MDSITINEQKTEMFAIRKLYITLILFNSCCSYKRILTFITDLKAANEHITHCTGLCNVTTADFLQFHYSGASWVIDFTIGSFRYMSESWYNRWGTIALKYVESDMKNESIYKTFV